MKKKKEVSDSLEGKAPPQLSQKRATLMGMEIPQQSEIILPPNIKKEETEVFIKEETKEEIEEEEGKKVKKTEYDYLIILDELGQGGMGKVHKARHVVKRQSTDERMIDEFVAVKIVDFENIPEEFRQGAIDTFITEVKLASKLKHNNVINITDFDETVDGRVFFVMDFLEGNDLSDILRKEGSFAWNDVKPLLLQVCKGLHFAHEYTDNGEKKPIIHLDLKPENIFLTKDPEGDALAKVLDFGLAKIVTEEDSDSERKKNIIGTPGYMAPEQWLGETLDRRTDVYGMGAMMYVLLTGKFPFSYKARDPYPGEDSESYNDYLRELRKEHLADLCNKKPPSLRGIDGSIPEAVEKMIFKCLEKDPNDRYQSIKKLKEAIIECNGGNDTIEEYRMKPNLFVAGVEGRVAKELERKVTPKPGSTDVATADIDSSTPEPIEVATADTVLIPAHVDQEDTEEVEIPVQHVAAKSKKPKRRVGKLVIVSATGLLLAGAAVGVGVHVIGGKKKPAIEQKLSQDAGQPVDAMQPMVEPLTEDAGVSVDASPEDASVSVDAAEEVTTHKITVRTNVSGVTVYADRKKIGVLSRRKGTVDLPESSEPVVLRFWKKGYRSVRKRVVSDQDQTLNVRMKEKEIKITTEE
jgi:serine/threonine protein kinase